MAAVPPELERDLVTLVSKSVWLLRLMKSTDRSSGAYAGFLRRFREVVAEAGHKMDAIRYFVPEDECAKLLARLDCTWDERSRRLRLPEFGGPDGAERKPAQAGET